MAVAARPTMLRDATRCVAPQHESGTFRPAASAADGRPENPPQPFEKVESAPGIAPALAVAARPTMLRDATRCVGPQHGRGTFRPAATAADGRPENPPQTLENVESAPGNPIAATAPRGGGAARGGRRPNGASDFGPAACRPASRGTSARKIRRNALIRLNPRPGTGGAGVGPSPERVGQAARENAGIWSKFIVR